MKEHQCARRDRTRQGFVILRVFKPGIAINEMRYGKLAMKLPNGIWALTNFLALKFEWTLDATRFKIPT